MTLHAGREAFDTFSCCWNCSYCRTSVERVEGNMVAGPKVEMSTRDNFTTMQPERENK